MARFLPMLLGLCVLPVPAGADWQDFIPTPYQNGLALDAGSAYERIESDTSGRRVGTSDLFAKEKLTFVSDGFSYHPRFFQYHLLLAAALKQETYKSDGRDTVGSSGTALDYDLKLHFLPEHPYKLDLFTSRTEPLYKQHFSADGGAVTSRSGAVFSYRKKPYFLTLRSIDSTREWAQGSSALDLYGANALYIRELGGGRKLSFSGFYDHYAVRPSSGSGGDAGNSGIGNMIDLNTATLQSTISRSASRSDTEDAGVDSDGFTWLERMSLKLPLHFTSRFTYRYQRHDRTIAATATSGKEERSVNNRDYELDIVHKLYRSLETTYRLRRDSAASANGDAASTAHSLVASYSKSVPHGIFFAGANLSRSETDSTGQTTVANESHENLALNEVFSTQQREADCESVRVYLTDHAAGDRPVEVDFIAVPSPEDRCAIMVTGIPQDFDETVAHDYTVSYTLESASYSLETRSYGYNASLNLFHNNLNPYVSHTVTSAEVVSGAYPGNPSDGSVSTVGVILGSLPVRFLAEYQQSDGRANSYRRWRGEIGYNRSVTATTNVALTASHGNTAYPEGATANASQAYTDEATRFSANLQQRLFNRTLVLFGGGSYAAFQGLMNSSSYSLNAGLRWKIGKTTVVAGVNGYRSLREDPLESESTRSRQYFYLNFRRDIL